MKSVRTVVPKLGADSISVPGISSTSFTASTTTPKIWVALAVSVSMMTMHVFLVVGVATRPKRTARSMTGTTAPRRLTMPRTKVGIIGTSVGASYSRISLMQRMPTAKVSLPSMKVRY